MDEKIKLLAELVPQAVLKALTPEAVGAAPQSQRVGDMIIIRSFPFKIGRESRVRTIDGKIERVERPKPDDREPSNDLYLVDRGQLLNISREHLQIEKTESGYVLVDRGSACGSKIENRAVGGNDEGGRGELADGDVIGIGAKGTPYLYRFITLNGYRLEKNDQVA